MTSTHWQKHRIRASLVPFHCDGKLRSVISYYGNGEIGPPAPYARDTRTVAERERDLYLKAMAES
jgi:hypothetical protein